MKQLGKLQPLYRFVLNPLEEVRFSTCPECRLRTLLRKVPLLVHVDPIHPVLLNKRCRYCSDCDLLIVHQDELEPLLVMSFEEQQPEIIGNDYLVLGTVDKSIWRRRDKEPLTMENIPARLHDFKEYLSLSSYIPAGWYHKDQLPSPRPAPPPSKPTGWQRQGEPLEPAMPTIDDPQQVEDLMRKMEAQLPISAELTRAATNFLRGQGSFVPHHRQVSISKIFYHGDEGGIVCTLSTKGSKEAVVISLTHLKISYHHPLAKEIRAYQKARLRKIDL
jgi:hypothetical protein